MKTYRLGIEAALEILGGKWKALIICLLMSGPQRTGALRRLIPGVSEKVLIQQLRELERDGIVGRIDCEQLPPKVEYFITDYGRSADRIVDVMCAWGRENIRLRRERGEEIELLSEEELLLPDKT